MDTIIQLSSLGDTILHYLLPFLFVLTIVVFVHEFGHFLMARWCGVAVKVFSMSTSTPRLPWLISSAAPIN